MLLRSLAFVFVDAVLANLLVFFVGQAFAWGYLRTGRFWVGTASTTLLWVSLDWWLVARYLFTVGADGQYLPVLLMQATAVVTTVMFLWARMRRRLARALREQRFQKGVRQMLSGDDAAAVQMFRQLVWSDPWDAAAWLALGDEYRRTGDAKRARSCYRRARGVDVAKQFADLLRHRDSLLAAKPQTKVTTSPGKTKAARKQAPAAVASSAR